MMRNYSNPSADAHYQDLLENLSNFPFLFTYDSKTYHGFSPEFFTHKDTKVTVSDEKEANDITWAFVDGLEVKLHIVHYFSHGATEWTVYFENAGSANTGILGELRAQVTFKGKYPSLKGILGDYVNFYRPYEIDLTDNFIDFSSDSGRPTHVNFPYFNLEHGDGGAMLAIGWSGTWRAEFSSDGQTTTYTANAVNGMKTYLKPGEKVRSALFVFAPYTVRNEHYATNYWRDWFVRYNLPKADKEGNALQPFSTAFLEYDTGRPTSAGSISENYESWRPSLKKLLAEDIHPDFRWMDAGWYVASNLTSAIPNVPGRDWYDTVGSWEFDPVKWPGNSFRESTDFARAHGMKTLLWFEPERVTDPENLVKNFAYKPQWATHVPGCPGTANNIGDPECWDWTTKRICKVLRDNRIELYREDVNSEVGGVWEYWDQLDGPNRRGISESKFITGHYAMWDTIIACTLSFGGCGFVDSCAGGGGRNDLESMRRGVPIMRSDYASFSSKRLSMTTAVNKWLPFAGSLFFCDCIIEGKTFPFSKYSLRTAYLPTFNFSMIRPTQDPSTDFDLLRFAFREWNKVKPYLLSEFYVLTPWRSEADCSDFVSYCFFDPKTETGYLFAFRLEHCAREKLTIGLPFANGENYILTDEDTGEEFTCRNKAEILFDTPKTAKLFFVKKA